MTQGTAVRRETTARTITREEALGLVRWTINWAALGPAFTIVVIDPQGNVIASGSTPNAEPELTERALSRARAALQQGHNTWDEQEEVDYDLPDELHPGGALIGVVPSMGAIGVAGRRHDCWPRQIIFRDGHIARGVVTQYLSPGCE